MARVWFDPYLAPLEPPANLKSQWFQLGSAKFQILPNQWKFLSAPEEFCGYISGVGGGKTRIGAIKSAYLSMHPQNRGLVGRFALPDLEETAMRDLLDFLHEAQLIKEAPNTRTKRVVVHCIDPVTQKNLGYTSEITFQHLDDPDHLRGRHLGWFWIDEGSELRSAKAWNTLVGRLRLPAFKNRYKGIVTGNPRGRNWIYDFFFNEELLASLTCGGKPGSHLPGCNLGDDRCNRKLRLKRRAIHSTSIDNYFLPPDYIANMIASYSDEARRREIEAEFDVFEGQVFKEFSHETHVVDTRGFRTWTQGDPPAEWPRVLAVDVGGSSPWAFIWAAIDPAGNIVFYDEVYKTTSNVDELADLALPKMRHPDRSELKFKSKVIDYENKVAAEDLRRRGIAMTNARKMNKTGDGGSVARLSGYLHPHPKHSFPEWHPRAGAKGSPRAFFTQGVPNLIRELPQQQWDQEASSDRLRDVMDRRIANHATDCAFYIVRELPPSWELPVEHSSAKVSVISKISEMYWHDVRAAAERKDSQQRRPYHGARRKLFG